METRGFEFRIDKVESCQIMMPEFKEEKFCWQCRRFLSIDSFCANKTRPDGRQSECKDCQKATRDRKRKQ